MKNEAAMEWLSLSSIKDAARAKFTEKYFVE